MDLVVAQIKHNVSGVPTLTMRVVGCPSAGKDKGFDGESCQDDKVCSPWKETWEETWEETGGDVLSAKG